MVLNNGYNFMKLLIITSIVYGIIILTMAINKGMI